MSWDATIFKSPGRTRPEDDLGTQQSLGSLREVRSLLEQLFSTDPRSTRSEVYVCVSGGSLKLDCETLQYLRLVKETYGGDRLPTEEEKGRLWEYAPGENEPVIRIGVEARHGGDIITPLIELCRAGDWQLFDHQTSQVIDLANPEGAHASWRDFVGYVNEVMRRADEGKL